MLTLYTLVMVALLFGMTIFVHEFGHFLVARKLGMVIETFSIGFGPALWKKKIGGINYKIGMIPFGGYVALPQMDPSGGTGISLEGKSEKKNLPPVAPWQRILVSLAGVTGNILLAVVLANAVYRGGKSFAPEQETAHVGYVVPDSAAAKAGLSIGDEILAVNDRPVSTWEDFLVAGSLHEELSILFRRPNGEERTARLATEKFMGMRFIPGLQSVSYCWVLSVEPDSTAEQAGVRARDRLVTLDGVTLFSRDHLIDLVRERAGRTVPLVLERAGERLAVEVTPAMDEATGRVRIGVVFNTLDVKRPGAQIKTHALLFVRVLRSLLTPKEARAAAGAVGGPLAIIWMYWLYVQNSFLMALWFTGMLNVNLAILNILPIPVLDGGHILFALWEMVFRRPVPARVINFLMNLFATLLIALFLLLTYGDLAKMVRQWFRHAPVESVEPPVDTAPSPEAGVPAQ